MKKLIILSGSSNIGKTETLNWLVQNSRTVLKNTIKDDGSYVCNINGKIVDICTAGDNDSITNENINFFNKNNADCYISAARSNGKTINLLESWAQKNNIKCICISKTYINDIGLDPLFNNKFSDFIKSLI